MSTGTVRGTALDDVGAGEPALLCLPGWCGNRDVYDPFLERMGGRRRALAVDLPAHGGSAAPAGDFGVAEVVEALEAVIEERGPALELARRLGRQRVPGLVLVDWMVLGPPPGFTDALAAMQDPAAWEQVRAGLTGMWTEGVEEPAVHRYVQDMAGYGFAHWSRAGREITRSFTAEGSPLQALSRLPEPCPTLHVYATPRDEEYLAAQRDFARDHQWFTVHRLDARSHFPMLEVPEEMASVIEGFAAELA
jgi:pimeloyl-ACP methyl ester carboxylesterase